MKKQTQLHWVLLIVAVVAVSCSDDNSSDPTVPGSDRDKFTGSWLCKETVSGNSPNTFTINIEKHGSDDTLYVYNFNNLGSANYAIWLVSSNSVTIPSQTVTQTDLLGSGFYSNDKITLNYTSDSESVSATCTH